MGVDKKGRMGRVGGMKDKIEVYLGNWGTIVCFNKEHREYLIAAKALSEIKQSVASWHGAWLDSDMQKKYEESERIAQENCDKLWEVIPDKTEDLSKSH